MIFSILILTPACQSLNNPSGITALASSTGVDIAILAIIEESENSERTARRIVDITNNLSELFDSDSETVLASRAITVIHSRVDRTSLTSYQTLVYDRLMTFLETQLNARIEQNKIDRTTPIPIKSYILSANTIAVNWLSKNQSG